MPEETDGHGKNRGKAARWEGGKEGVKEGVKEGGR